MGGVNFTRNRAWWHTAVWDEYGQRHQYLALIPCMLFMIPLYWYGSFTNRELAQVKATKMYQLDYENKRLRLTHNMIMEHFEMHVEKSQDILDQVKEQGFEKTFQYEISNPAEDFEVKTIVPFITKEYMAEVDEYIGLTAAVDEMVQTKMLPYSVKEQLEKTIHRRKNPHSPYKFLSAVSSNVRTPAVTTNIDPFQEMNESDYSVNPVSTGTNKKI